MPFKDQPNLPLCSFEMCILVHAMYKNRQGKGRGRAWKSGCDFSSNYSLYIFCARTHAHKTPSCAAHCLQTLCQLLVIYPYDFSDLYMRWHVFVRRTPHVLHVVYAHGKLWCSRAFCAAQKVRVVQKLGESRLNLKCSFKKEKKNNKNTKIKKCVGSQLEPCSYAPTLLCPCINMWMYRRSHACMHACRLCKYAWEPTFASTSECVNPCDDDATCQDTHTPHHQLLL